ncbi:MAG TPA: DUF6499 domain-containing protein [Rhizomicrobium sp.]|jgi:hypothetical protein
MKKRQQSDEWNQTAGQYEYLEKLDRIRMAWEFLRRGERYKALYSKFSQTPNADEAAHYFFLMKHFIDPSHTPLADAEVSLLRVPPMVVYPGGKEKPALFFPATAIAKTVSASNTKEVTIKFDLDGDLDFQLLVARTYLFLDWSKRNNNHRATQQRIAASNDHKIVNLQNIHYLRVLDAGNLKIKHGTIADLLDASYQNAFKSSSSEIGDITGNSAPAKAQKKKKGAGRAPAEKFSASVFEKHLKRAKALADGGYIHLLRPSSHFDEVWLKVWDERLERQAKDLGEIS